MKLIFEKWFRSKGLKGNSELTFKTKQDVKAEVEMAKRIYSPTIL